MQTSSILRFVNDENSTKINRELVGALTQVDQLMILMEFTFKNFGKAGSGTVRINDLTIICGPNNSGKTYLNYAIFSILRDFNNIVDFGLDYQYLKNQILKLSSNSNVEIDLSHTITELAKFEETGFSNIGPTIHTYFGVPKEHFQNTIIDFKLDEMKYNDHFTATGDIVKDMIGYLYFYSKYKSYMQLFKPSEKLNAEPPLTMNENNISFLIYEIKNILYRYHFSNIVPWPFVITAERSGVTLFYKTYDSWNSSLLYSGTTEIDSKRTKLAQPILLNISDIRLYDNVQNRMSFIVRENHTGVLELLSEMLDFGSYVLADDTLFFQPHTGLADNDPIVPIHATSSSIKSFFFLNLFIKNIAEQNTILVIDEPEMNLYIDKQVKFARLVARLVNLGVKVLVTTHSDYFIREINNLITVNSLPNDSKKEVMSEFNILECDLLNHSEVSVYKTDLEQDIQGIKVSDMGIGQSEWNRLIDIEDYKFNKICHIAKSARA